MSFLGNMSYRGEYDDLELLKSQWVFPLTAPKKDVGAVTVDDTAMDGDDTPSPWTWLWCQPLSEIRNYFGDGSEVVVEVAPLYIPPGIQLI